MGLKSSADTIGGWQNHFRRLERWKNRVLSSMENTSRADFHDVNDFVLAYFMWCHSLRDWLIQSEVIGSDELDLKLGQFVEWAVCRDIANRNRHFKITRSPRDKDWSISREYDWQASVENRPERHRLFVVSDDRIFMVDDLVNRTFEMWGSIVSFDLVGPGSRRCCR